MKTTIIRFKYPRCLDHPNFSPKDRRTPLPDGCAYCAEARALVLDLRPFKTRAFLLKREHERQQDEANKKEDAAGAAPVTHVPRTPADEIRARSLEYAKGLNPPRPRAKHGSRGRR